MKYQVESTDLESDRHDLKIHNKTTWITDEFSFPATEASAGEQIQQQVLCG
jgi:hypothetical protein